MFYEWKDGDNDPNLSHKTTAVDSTIELDSLSPSSDTDLTADDKPQVLTRKKSEGMSVRFAQMRVRGELEHRFEDGDDNATEVPPYTNVLRVIKVASLLLIGVCALVGMVFSKITFVSITGRMYTLYTASPQDTGNNPKSVIFFQLVFILVIPEILSLAHCVIWGFIGKTSKSFPWPSWKAMVLVSILLQLFDITVRGIVIIDHVKVMCLVYPVSLSLTLYQATCMYMYTLIHSI